MSGLADDNLRFVLLHAMADAVKKELGKLRADHTSTLVDVYEETKGTTYKVSLPGDDDAVVATVTLRVPKPELEFDGVEGNDAAFVRWAAANHPDMVELEHVPAVPEKVIPAVPAHDVPFINSKKLTELTKHFVRGDDGEVVDTTTGVVVEGASYTTPGRPSQFEVRYESDGRDRIGTAYRAGRLNEVVGGTSLGAITAGPVVERRLVLAEPVSDEEWDAVPVAPPVDQEPISPSSVVEAFGEDAPYRNGAECPGGTGCAGCASCDPDGDYSRFAGDGDQGWRAAPGDDAAEAPAGGYSAAMVDPDDAVSAWLNSSLR